MSAVLGVGVAERSDRAPSVRQVSEDAMSVGACSRAKVGPYGVPEIAPQVGIGGKQAIEKLARDVVSLRRQKRLSWLCVPFVLRQKKSQRLKPESDPFGIQLSSWETDSACSYKVPFGVVGVCGEDGDGTPILSIMAL